MSGFIEENPAEAEEKGAEIGRMMSAIHENGIVLEDWDLNNLILRDGEMILIDMEYGRHSSRRIDREIEPLRMLMGLRTLNNETYKKFREGFLQERDIPLVVDLISVFFALGW